MAKNTDFGVYRLVEGFVYDRSKNDLNFDEISDFH
jgi:hypothetical protein